jgi:hypothetical protein
VIQIEKKKITGCFKEKLLQRGVSLAVRIGRQKVSP